MAHRLPDVADGVTRPPLALTSPHTLAQTLRRRAESYLRDAKYLTEHGSPDRAVVCEAVAVELRAVAYTLDRRPTLARPVVSKGAAR